MLQKLRKLKGYNQEELARIIGLSKRTLQDIEQGRRDINKVASDTLYKMSIALGCDMADLLDVDNAKDEVYSKMAEFLADIEMDAGSHDDYLEDYDSELDFFLSNASGDGYLVYLEDTWNIPEEDTADMQDRVISAIKEKTDGR